MPRTLGLLTVRGVVRRVTLHYMGRTDLHLEEMFLQLEYFHSMFSQLVDPRLEHRLDVLPFSVEDTNAKNSQNK